MINYAIKWVQRKKVQPGLTKRGEGQIVRVVKFIDAAPAALIARRAVDCGQYPRALFHLEPYLQSIKALVPTETRSPDADQLLSELQYIYSQIDEPDSLEGLFAHLPSIHLDQQIMGHRKAGRWTAAQTWYEIRLAKDPGNVDVQLDLLTCLKESGQHGMRGPFVPECFATSLTASRCASEPCRRHENNARHHQQDSAVCRGSFVGHRAVGHAAEVPSSV